MATQKQRIYELEQQVRNLVQAVEEVTRQVTICMYCGKFIKPDEHRTRDTGTNLIMHDDCFISMLNDMVRSQEQERLAEKRNEEALYGYEIEVTQQGPYIECDSCHTFQSFDKADFSPVQVGEPDDNGMCETENWCRTCINLEW